MNCKDCTKHNCPESGKENYIPYCIYNLDNDKLHRHLNHIQNIVDHIERKHLKGD